MRIKRKQNRINFENSMSSLLKTLVRTRTNGIYDFCEDNKIEPMTLYRYMDAKSFDYFRVYTIIGLFGDDMKYIFRNELHHALEEDDYPYQDGVDLLRNEEYNVNRLYLNEQV